MTREERKSKIAEIYKGIPVGTGTKLQYKGETKDFDVYLVPLELLVYNIDNGRIGSVVKSHRITHSELSAETDAQILERFLLESNQERNSHTEADIAEKGQLDPGIITMDGVIIDGNRRAAILNNIRKSDKYSQSQKDRSGYFRTRILPEDADQKEILRLETTFQMGSDNKVDYNAIEKYLHARELSNVGFSDAEIAEYMGLDSRGKVSDLLATLQLMDEYLENYDYAGIYTKLPRGCEDDFLKLLSSVKKIQSGHVAWIPADEVQEQVINVKSICFDYIRLGLKHGFDYRAIAFTRDANFLNDETTWKQFVDRHFETTDGVVEESLDDTLASAESDDDIKHLLARRDEKWKDSITSALEENYSDAKNRIENKKEKTKPLSLLKRAKNALEEIDCNLVSQGVGKDDFLAKLKELEEIMESIRREVQ